MAAEIDFVVTILCGMIAGFGHCTYSAQDKKLQIPHRDSQDPTVFRFGFLDDIIFGDLAAAVIFGENILTNATLGGWVQSLVVWITAGIGGSAVLMAHQKSPG